MAKRQGRVAVSAAQVAFEFEAGPVATVLPLVRPTLPTAVPAPVDAEGWYDRGCDEEAASPDRAASFYRAALAADPGHYGANLNLGRLLHEGGRLAEADALYRTALARRPGDATATYNLGVALEDQGREVEALAAYEQCLAADPGFEDARVNAGRLAGRLGREQDQIRHLGAAVRLARR